MTYYAIFNTESGEESVMISEGVMLTFDNVHYGASLDQMREFLENKKIVNGKGKEVSFDTILSQIRIMQENPTIYSKLSEEFVTGSSLDVYKDEESNLFFRWKRSL